LSQCQKCSEPISFVRREFRGVMKWCPVNVDGTDHWDQCKRATRKRLMGESVENVMAYAESQFPTRWTIPNGKGGYRVVFKKPDGWDERAQPAPDAELF
jgi:hypothetical protein